MERQKGDRCGIDNCRSRYYHLEDGQWTCSQGHVQEGRLDIREDDEYQPRKGDRRVVETDDAGTTVEKVFTGRKGLSLFLQAYQLILRKHVAWLINEKKFPSEFELLVRDLWTLRLEAIYSDRSSSRAGSSSGYTSAASQSGYESEGGASQSNASNDGWRDTASQTSTSAMSISTSRSRSSSRGRRLQKREYGKTAPKLMDSICICYLAAILLQLPLDVLTVHRWIMEQGLVYFRAIDHLPKEMVDKLETKWKRKFEPKILPTAGRVRRSIYEHLRYYHKRFDIVIPRVNAECLLLGYILELGCPPEAYPAVFNIAKMIGLDFQYPASAQNLNLVGYPDVQLMALLIISLKLCYGFDGIKRHAKDKSEIANMVPDWELWKEILQMKETDIKPEDFVGGRIREKNWQLATDESEIYQFTDKELDEYLDWFEENLAGHGKAEGKPTSGILKLFEDDDEPGKAAQKSEENDVDSKRKLFEQRITAFKSMQNIVRIKEPIPEGVKSRKDGKNIVRPGEQYQRYRSWEDITSEKIKVLYSAAAERMALRNEEFAYVVQKLEYKIGRIAKEKHKEAGNRKEDNTEIVGGEDVEDTPSNNETVA